MKTFGKVLLVLAALVAVFYLIVLVTAWV